MADDMTDTVVALRGGYRIKKSLIAAPLTAP